MGWQDPRAQTSVLTAAEQRLGTVVDGKYRIVSVIGVGGMGVVYEAEHLFLDRSVALKVLHPRYQDVHEAAQRFLREARTLGRIGHRSIVQVLDGGFVDGTTPYLVMERLVGENLAQRILRRQALRLEQVVVVLREVLKGLSAAHAKGIIHCDLKPENVFLAERAIQRRAIKILDFGIARMITAIPEDTGDRSRTYGTPEYMSPEQIRGGVIDTRTDLYGVGVVAYEALTGRPPFPADTEVRRDVFKTILRDPPPAPIGLRDPIPPPLTALLLQLLAKDPNLRPASAVDVICALDDLNLVAPVSLPSIRAAKPVGDG
ncbi:MAG: serine/threonine-protein kinase [Myxococcales bacterium]